LLGSDRNSSYRLDIRRKKMVLKKIVGVLFEIMAHSGNYLWLPQEIGCFYPNLAYF
jgi:hypothetical protein